MPRDYDHFPRPLDIAVIGTGIAGLSAAWLLSKAHNVSVYEQDGRVGGHSNTVLVPDGSRSIAVDTGFIVYNELNYPNLTGAAKQVNREAWANVTFPASDPRKRGGKTDYQRGYLKWFFSRIPHAPGRGRQLPRAWLAFDVLDTNSRNHDIATRNYDTPGCQFWGSCESK